MPALPYSGVQWAEWAGNVGQLIEKLVNLYKQKLTERHKNMVESEKTSLAFTMYDKLSTTDTLHNNEKRMHTGFWWGQLKGKRPLGRPGCRYEHNIKMKHKAIC